VTDSLAIVKTVIGPGVTENAVVENAIRAKLHGWKYRSDNVWKAVNTENFIIY